MIDEPSSYLDVRQRLKAAEVIRGLLAPGKFVIVVEHDLSVLDYLSDFICCLYGKPGAYGALAPPLLPVVVVGLWVWARRGGWLVCGGVGGGRRGWVAAGGDACVCACSRCGRPPHPHPRSLSLTPFPFPRPLLPLPAGVVTLPFSVREGINIFLAGFVPTENLRFRDEALSFKVGGTRGGVGWGGMGGALVGA